MSKQKMNNLLVDGKKMALIVLMSLALSPKAKAYDERAYMTPGEQTEYQTKVLLGREKLSKEYAEFQARKQKEFAEYRARKQQEFTEHQTNAQNAYKGCVANLRKEFEASEAQRRQYMLMQCEQYKRFIEEQEKQAQK